jgi:hypothetical protein
MPQMKFMAYVTAKASSVLVAAKVGGAAKRMLPEMAGGASGGKYFKGQCIFEKNVHTFVLDQVPAGLARKLATALHSETGTKYKVRVRSTDGSVDLDSDADKDPDEIPMPPTQQPGVDVAVKFNERLKALLPQAKAAIAANTPVSQTIKLKASVAGALAKMKDFIKANSALDELEALLKGQPTTTTTAATGTPGETGYKGIIAYRTALLGFDAAKKSVSAQLEALRKAIPAVLPEEADYADELAAELEDLNEELGDAVDAAMNASENAKSPVTDTLRRTLQSYITELASNALVNHVDTNPFGVAVSVQATLGGALKKIVDNFPIAA